MILSGLFVACNAPKLDWCIKNNYTFWYGEKFFYDKYKNSFLFNVKKG